MVIDDIIRESVEKLKSAELENPLLDAQVLIAHILKTERFKLVLEKDREITASEQKKIRAVMNRRVKHEPVAYIVGVKEFYSLEFMVNSHVLIPRPETELLVDLAVYYAPQKGSVIDIGTGSGVIAVSLKHSRNDLAVSATDISADALIVARKNAGRILGPGAVTFYSGDLFSPVAGKKYDLILSNPPYIDPASRPTLQKDLDYEPDMALYCEDRGRQVIRNILDYGRGYLRDGGRLIIEIGSDMKDFIIKEGKKQSYSVSVLNDYGGLPRVAVLQ